MKLIIACDPIGGIGYNNKLPWDKLQGDLPRFKDLTKGKIIVMGRKTWDSLPIKPLPGRINYVYTSDSYSLPLIHNNRNGMAKFETTSVYGFNNLNMLNNLNDNAFIIGGAQLIEKTWIKINEVHLSRTKDHYTCDRFIDLVYLEDNFKIIKSTEHIDHFYEIWRRD